MSSRRLLDEEDINSSSDFENTTGALPNDSESAPLLADSDPIETLTRTKMTGLRDEDLESHEVHDTRKTVNAVLYNTREAAEEEKQLGVIAALRIYPRAMFWSMFFSIAVIMVGYDALIITNFYALTAFTQKYGHLTPDNGYQISAAWQSALSMGSPIGQVLGALGCSWPAEKWGRKRTLMFCCVAVIGLIFMQFFAPSLVVLCVGEILAGQFWGAFVTLAPTYASEVAPVALRGILESFINLAFVIGQFIGQGVTTGVNTRTDEWAYKIPFAVQWIWPVILLIGMPFAPESPWWLVRKGRSEDAKKALRRLAWADEAQLDKQLMVIEQTDLLERELNKTSSYLELFRGVNFRRTEICAMVYSIQVLCGNPLMGYYSYFFLQAGLAQDDSFKMALGNTAIGFLATCLSFVALSYAGRRKIYNWGLYIMTLFLLIIGIIDCVPHYGAGESWAQATLLDIWTFFYQLTVGPLTFVIISEVSSTKLRSKTIAVATATQSVFAIATTVAMPYMFNPENGNLRGKTAFVYGGLSLICCVWCFFRLPETQNRTFEEIDIMFERRVKTRDFAEYDAFAEES